MHVDDDFVHGLVADLVRINSINPSLDSSSPGERLAAECVAAALDSLDVGTEIVEAEPGRATVIGIVPGTGGGRSLMLNAHIDTVGVDGMADPFSADVRDGQLFGRGAFDMKGAMAACVGAVKVLRDAGVQLAGNLVITGVADEEYSSLGMESVINKVTVDGAIVTEPTALRVCLAHKGYVWTRVEVTGRAAHGSRLELGVDANVRMGRVLVALEQLNETLVGGTPHPLVGPPSLHAAVLRGGTGVSTYAAQSVLDIERRTVPGETVAQVEAEVQGILERLRAAEETFVAEAKMYFSREPFEVSPGAAIVKAVDQATETVLGERRPHIGDTPWMDSALLAAAGVETVVIGPAGGGAHAAVEWVDLDSVSKLSHILAEAAMTYCGVA